MDFGGPNARRSAQPIPLVSASRFDAAVGSPKSTFGAGNSIARGVAALADTDGIGFTPLLADRPNCRRRDGLNPLQELLMGFELSVDEVEAFTTELARLREEHRDLDSAIDALERVGSINQIQVQRLKKRKLYLKDRIAQIEDALTPDIIA